MICNDCAIKVDNFHNFALFAQKNQEIFTRINAEKVYQEHCKSLSSLNTTLYRETTIQQSPPLPQSVIHSPPLHPHQHQVEVASTEDITIFAYNDLKLGQLIKDIELLKLILRALKWKENGETLDQKLDRLRNTSFRAVLSSPDLLQDEDLVLLLGPYLDKSAFGGAGQKQQQQQQQQSQQMYNDSNAVTEMEVGVDPELFFYDDDEPQSTKDEDFRPPMSVTPMVTAVSNAVTTAAATTTTTATIQAKRTRKIVPKKRTPKSKATAVLPPLSQVSPLPPLPQTTTVEPISAIKPARSRKKKNVSVSFLLPDTTPVKSEGGTVTVKKMEDLMKPIEPIVELETKPIPAIETATTIVAGEADSATTDTSPKKVEQPQLVQRILQKSKETLKHTKLGRGKDDKVVKKTKTRARVVLNLTPSLKCQVCNKKFSTKGNLTAHMRTHKVKGKFTCDKCGRM